MHLLSNNPFFLIVERIKCIVEEDVSLQLQTEPFFKHTNVTLKKYIKNDKALMVSLCNMISMKYSALQTTHFEHYYISKSQTKPKI